MCHPSRLGKCENRQLDVNSEFHISRSGAFLTMHTVTKPFRAAPRLPKCHIRTDVQYLKVACYKAGKVFGGQARACMQILSNKQGAAPRPKPAEQPPNEYATFFYAAELRSMHAHVLMSSWQLQEKRHNMHAS
jgi:hypothetical protein